MKISIHTLFLLLFFTSSSLFGQDKVRALHGNWKFRLGDNMQWATANFDDSNWDEIYAPSEWENEGFNGYDQYLWHKKADFNNRLFQTNSN